MARAMRVVKEEREDDEKRTTNALEGGEEKGVKTVTRDVGLMRESGGTRSVIGITASSRTRLW